MESKITSLMTKLKPESWKFTLSMNDEDIDIIQSSWHKLVGREEAAVARFYNLLFEKRPDYRPLFSESDEAQRSKFMAMLNLIVNGLEHLEAIEGQLLILGRKHKHLNISQQDYDIVANTLVEALDDISDRPFSDGEREAWMKGLMLVSSIMIKESSPSDS